MRKQFVKTTSEILFSNDKSALLLGDIGVFGFRSALKEFPDRVFNFGILEQAMVSAAAGFAEKGFHPIVSTIAPFIVNRAFEQIKIDFGYQGLKGTFITVGASFDYAQLGATHYCPEDIVLISTIPEMNVYIPGSSKEVSTCIIRSQSNSLNYVRLSEQTHSYDIQSVGLIKLTENNSKKAIIFFGPSLELKSLITDDNAYEQYYCNELSSIFDQDFSNLNEITLVSDFYLDSVVASIALKNPWIELRAVSPDKQFYRGYGSYSDAIRELGCGAEKFSELLKELNY